MATSGNPITNFITGLGGGANLSITPQEAENAALGAAGANNAAGVQAAGNTVTSSLDAFVKAWNFLTSRALWIRIAEGALGIGLIFVAVLDMTGAKNAAELAAKVVK